MRKLAIAASLLLAAGCAAHGAVPLEESSGYTPETIRQMVAGRVFVYDRHNGYLVARHYRPDGTWDYCGADDDGAARSYGHNHQKRWVVGADAQGRAIWRPKVKGKSQYLYVPHYDPESGELAFRHWDKSGGWVTAAHGWLQASWPKVMAERCPGLAAGVPVDERQTAMTLEGLRRQTPDAALKNLATPLPPAVGGQGAAPASGALQGSGAARAEDDAAASAAGGGVDPASELTDALISGGKAHALAFMGAAYADRRFVFIADGHLVVVDGDGNLAPGEGFEGSWRRTDGSLEIRVAGDSRAHAVSWEDLAQELGVTSGVWTVATPNTR